MHIKSIRKKKIIILLFLLFFIILTIGIVAYTNARPILQLRVYHEGIVDRRLTYRLYENGQLFVSGILERPLVENTITTEEWKDDEKKDLFQNKLEDFYNLPIRWWSISDVYERWLMPVIPFMDICFVPQEEMESILDDAQTAIKQSDAVDKLPYLCLLNLKYDGRSTTFQYDGTWEISKIHGLLEMYDLEQNGRNTFVQPAYLNPSYTFSKMAPRWIVFLTVVILMIYVIVVVIVKLIKLHNRKSGEAKTDIDNMN